MESENKLNLYDLHDKLNGTFTSNYKLNDNGIKKIGLNSNTVTSGALENTSGMKIENVASMPNNNIDVMKPLNMSNLSGGASVEPMSVSNTESMQPLNMESMVNDVPAVNVNPVQSEVGETVGMPAYGVPVEPSVEVTPNMFNPLEGVYNDAKSFMESPETSNTFVSSEPTQEVVNNTSELNQSANVPLQNTVEPPIQSQETLAASENTMPVVDAPVIPSVAPVSEMPVSETPVETMPTNDSQNRVDTMPLFDTPVVPQMNETVVEPQVLSEVQVPTQELNEPVEEKNVSEPPVVNEVAEMNNPEPVISDVVNDNITDIKAEIEDVIKAMDVAREKLVNLREKLNVDKISKNTEVEMENVVPFVPNVQNKIPMEQEIPTVQPLIQNNLNAGTDVSSYFGRAA